MAQDTEGPEGSARPSSRELRSRLRALPQDQRRAVSRAVRQGMPVPDARHAGLAVALARRDQRNAQFGWLVFPLGGLVLVALGRVGATGVIIASVIGAYLSTLTLARAVRAERLNRGLLRDPGEAGTLSRPVSGAPSDRPRTGGRLPVRRTGRSGGHDEDHDDRGGKA